MSWEKKSSSYVHENSWYKVRQDKVTMPNGKPGTYNVVETRGSVYIVALNDERKFPLVCIYRYTTDITSFEIPAGGIDEGENTLDAAMRELKEETGFVASDWASLGTLQAANGISNAMANIFLAKGLSLKEAHGQLEEDISQVRSVSFDEAFQMIKNGLISCAQSIAAITLAYAADL